MSTKTTPISGRTIVITGASSGIGLATARMAAARGAKLLLISRNGQALRALCEELRARGGVADFVEADVGDQEALRQAARRADELYGGFDTWVNNAGVTVYGTLEDTPIEDQRKLFETNYWGTVYGSMIAVEHLKARTEGGVLINVGSLLADQSVPLQGGYSATKHAMKSFTNTLRMELKTSAPKVRVTLVKPSSMDSPVRDHARNYTGAPVKNPPPVYATPLAAEAILYAVENPVRELRVGGGGRAMTLFGEHLPQIAEPLFAWAVPKVIRYGVDARAEPDDALYKPGRALRERSPYLGVRQTSLYTQAQMNPRLTASVAAGAAGGILLLLAARDALRLHRTRRDAVQRWRASHEVEEA